MQLTFTEKHTPHVGLCIDVNKHLFTAQSAFQRIDVLESPEFGRLLVLDGILMLTEKDEFIYHEMIVHVPMAVHPAARRVLVIGGGDGGAVRELCKYDAVESIDLVEIDAKVVEVCREYLPTVSQSFPTPRVNVRYEDGSSTCGGAATRMTSSLWIPPTVRAGRRPFHQGVLRQLLQGAERGRHTGQPAREPFYPNDAAAVKRIHKQIVLVRCRGCTSAYSTTRPALAVGFVQEVSSGAAPGRGQVECAGIKTRYYNTTLHKAAFALHLCGRLN